MSSSTCVLARGVKTLFQDGETLLVKLVLMSNAQS